MKYFWAKNGSEFHKNVAKFSREFFIFLFTSFCKHKFYGTTLSFRVVFLEQVRSPRVREGHRVQGPTYPPRPIETSNTWELRRLKLIGNFTMGTYNYLHLSLYVTLAVTLFVQFIISKSRFCLEIFLLWLTSGQILVLISR